MEKRDFLFRFVDATKRACIQLDEEALYSTTDQLTAEKITKDILKYVSADASVTDATACVGGNTFSFAQSFHKVYAIEKDENRHKMLESNMAVLEVSNVTCIHGDALEICHRLQQDVIFLDPPWGGPEYKQKAHIDLYLSDIALYTVCEKLASCTSYFALKVPTNFHESKFIAETSHFLQLRHRNTHLRKMNLLIFQVMYAPQRTQ
jgi:16S rRNA G966 N2-methylase RsmD